MRMQEVLATARSLLDVPENTLVMFTESPIVARAAAAALDAAVVTGATKMAAKHRILSQFQDGAHRALVLTFSVAAVGLNLTAGNNLLYIDPPPTAAVAAQSLGRLCRIGQTRRVHVYTWPVEHTFEMAMPRSDRTLAVRLH